MAASGPSPVGRDGGFAAPPSSDPRAKHDLPPPLDPRLVEHLVHLSRSDSPICWSIFASHFAAWVPIQIRRYRRTQEGSLENLPKRTEVFPYFRGYNMKNPDNVQTYGMQVPQLLTQEVAAPDEFTHETASIIHSSNYINLQINKRLNCMEEMPFGSGLAEKAKLYDELSKKLGLPMNCGPDKKTIHEYQGTFLMFWNHLKSQFATSLTSNPLCSKVLVEPFHGIESLNDYFPWDGGEQFIWTLPIMRPLGPGAQAIDFWIDSGCAHHVVGEESILVDLREPPPEKKIKIADGSLIPVHAVGTVNMPGFVIPDAYFVPGAVVNLISIGQLADRHKMFSSFDGDGCVLWTGSHIELVGEGIMDKRRGLYRLTFLYVP